MDSGQAPGGQAAAVPCQQCGRTLSPGEQRVQTEGGVFCPSCFDQLKAQLTAVADAQGRDINYFMALLGGCLGGAAGAAVWWGFTILTEFEFGLVAIVIGLAVSRGILYLTGGKRALPLQILSVAIAGISYFYAKYLVSRSFALQGEDGIALPWFPDLELFYRVLTLTIGGFDLVFLAIVIWEAWRGLAPLKVARGATT